MTSTENRLTNVEQTVGGYSSRIDNLNNRVDKVEKLTDKAMDGVAIALAVAEPALTTGSTFGMRVNWGHYGGHHALGVSGLGVIGRNTFGTGETIALNAGFGVSLQDGSVGSRVGMQFTW